MKFLCALLVLFACAGCSSVSSRVPPGLDLGHFQRIFVERRLNENNHVDEYLVRELRRIGKIADSGPLTMMPENTDAVMTYEARWTWDFKSYLIELNLELHTAHTKKKLADARYYQPNARPKPLAFVTEKIVQEMFDQ